LPLKNLKNPEGEYIYIDFQTVLEHNSVLEHKQEDPKKCTYRESLENDRVTTTTSMIDWSQYSSIPTHTGRKQEAKALKSLGGRELTYQEKRDRAELLDLLNQHTCFHGDTLYLALTKPTPILDHIYELKGRWKAGPGAYGIKLRNLIMHFEHDHTQPPAWNNPQPGHQPQ